MRSFVSSIVGGLLLTFALAGGLSATTVEHPAELATEDLTVAASGPETSPATEQIEWFRGDVDAAFAAARAQSKPLFLYWGARWCPYCAQLESSVFVKPEFVALSRRLIALQVDGDDLHAPELGKRFKVHGYPATLLFSANGEEINRLPAGSLRAELYIEAMNLALSSGASIKQHVQALLDEDKALDDVGWTQLARYAWYYDRQQALGARPLATTLVDLAQRCPERLGEPCRTLRFTALAESAREGEIGLPAPVALAALRSLLSSQEQIREQSEFLSGEVHTVLDVLQSAAPEQVDNLRSQWSVALQQLAADETLVPRERLLSQVALIGLESKTTGDDSEALIASTRSLVADASARSSDPLARQAIAGAAAHALISIGDPDAAEALVESALPGSRAGYYLMETMAHYADQRGDTEAEGRWRRRAFEDGLLSDLPRVSMRTASAYLGYLIAKRPQQGAEILQVSKAVLAAVENAFGGRFWLFTVASILIPALLAWRLSQPGSRLRALTRWLPIAVLIYLPISIAFTGNIELRFVNELGGVWLAAMAALSMVVLIALLSVIGARILSRPQGSAVV